MKYEDKLQIFRKYSGYIGSIRPVMLPNQIPDKALKNGMKKIVPSYNKDKVLGFLDTTISKNGKNGYFFMENHIYYLETLGKVKSFRYNEIESLELYDDNEDDKKNTIEIGLKSGDDIDITEPFLNKTPLYHFLKEMVDVCKSKSRVSNKNNGNTESENAGNSGAAVAGVVYGNVSNAASNYDADKLLTPRGHGFAAENASHLTDKVKNADFFGKDNVKLVGADVDSETGHIIKNGADRIVNGVEIQTKYCNSGSKCISECFEDGKLRYLNQSGKPMQIEVPSDMYDDAVKAMENRITRGEVPGVTDPVEAENIVRKGYFTYEQAKNIAKAGTVESITYDAVNGAIIASSTFGISAVLSFATSVWNGDDFDVALKNSMYTGLKVGGTTFAVAIISGQLAKAGLNSVLVDSSEVIVNLMGNKASTLLVNAFRNGKNIYGAAAMKSAAKMLRGNVITGVASVVVLSSVDVVNIFRGRISGKQLFKNLVNTSASVAGGTAGWAGGAAAGAAIGSVVPGIGTAVGGVVGSLVGAFAGGSAAGKASSKVMDTFIEDDADEMVRIIEDEFQILAVNYLLNRDEAEDFVKALSDELKGSTLKDMFSSDDREEFAEDLLLPIVEDIVSNREYVALPSQEQMVEGMRIVLEEIADQEQVG